MFIVNDKCNIKLLAKAVCQPHFDANCLPSEEPSTAAITTAATAIIVAIAAKEEQWRYNHFAKEWLFPLHLKQKKKRKIGLFLIGMVLRVSFLSD